MDFLLTAALFVLLTGLTTALGVKLWARPRSAMERITGAVAETETHVPVHPSLVFRELVVKLGALLPMDVSKSGLTQRRLIRAGYRSPQAIRVLRGARLLLAVTLPAGTFLLVKWLNLAGDMQGIAVAGAAIAGYAAPGAFVKLKGRRRQHRIRRGLPDALDLLVICVESGLGLDQALMQVAKELELAHPDISLEFTMVNVELRAGKRRADALRSMAERTAVDELEEAGRGADPGRPVRHRRGPEPAHARRLHARAGAAESRGTGGQGGRETGVPDFFLYSADAFRGDGRPHGGAHESRTAAHD